MKCFLKRAVQIDIVPAASRRDRTYKLSDTEVAVRYLEQGHARGKVVITTE